jgi:outer membrane receptor protein involved in Fe transport
MFKTTLSFFFFLLYQNFLSAQIFVTGKISDSKTKEALVGATVRIAGQGSITDIQGDYKIELSKTGSFKASITFVGYENLEKNVSITEGVQTLDFQISEADNILQTTTVTAGKFEKPLAEVTVSMDILKTKLIENVNTRRVDDVLQKVPGVNIIDGQANIRGGSGWSYGAGSRVLLLVDDIPALQADAGFPNWKDIPVENIEQIEVVKGAASALYGSSAMNGIINIRTGFAKLEPVTKIAAFFTDYLAPKDVKKQWWKGQSQPYEGGFSLSHAQKFGKFDFVGTGFYSNTSSFLKDNYDKYGRISFATRYRITDRLSVGVNANFNQSSRQDFFYFADHLDSALIGAKGSYNSGVRRRFWIDPYLNYFDKKGNKHKILARYYSVDNALTNNQSNTSKLYYGEYQFQRPMFDNKLIVTAGAVSSGTSVQAPLYGNNKYNSFNLAAYSQADIKWNRLNISLGARYESNTIYGPDSIKFNAKYTEAAPNKGTLKESKPVFRVGANYKVGKMTFLRASWGQGYRFPTIAELYINTAASALRIFPNPQLTSEKGWTAELGLKQGFAIGNFQAFADAAIFSSEYTNMMEFQLSSELFKREKANEFGFQSINVGNTVIKGVEFSVQGTGKVGYFTPSVLIGYTYIDPKFKNYTKLDSLNSSANYNVLKYRFKHNVKFDAELAHKKFLVGVAVLYNSNMEAIDRILETDLRPLLGAGGKPFYSIGAFRKTHNTGFSTLDIRAAYFFTPKFKLTVIGGNLANTEYAYRPGLLEAPRNVQVRMDYQF